MIRIIPYRRGSKSAKALSEALEAKVLKLEDSRWRPREGRGDIIINWGNTSEYKPEWLYAEGFFNLPENIREASNKKTFFELVQEVDPDIIPQFWVDRDDIPDDAYPVVCRTLLAGHSGAGIVIANERESLVDAPLYVKYIKKQQEYRVHVGRTGNETTVIAVQRKARNRAVPDEQIDWKVRNHANGFIFAREGFDTPPEVLDVAARGILCTGLDFGGCDVIWNERDQRAYLLEINTACGLSGTTIEDYANYFRNIVG